MKHLLFFITLVAAAMSQSNLEEVLKAGNDQFTAEMFQEVAKTQGDKSCVLSGFSVMSPLAQLALASVGVSHDEILKSIGFPNDTVTKDVFADVNTRLRSVKGIELKQANKIYVRDGFSLNDNFAALSKDVFNSEVQNLDFGQNVKAASEINTWVENQTNNRIKNLVEADSINQDTTAILVNAIYFKGKWKKPFMKEDTKESDFHLGQNKTITVPMMYQSTEFKYGESEELGAKFLEMAYEGDETSLVIVLPNEVDGINALIKKMRDPATLTKALENMYHQEVQVSLPRFKIETTTNLKDVLQKMNVKKLFISGEARLDNLLKDAKDLYISDATQKAFIEVNEEGAEAAAANQFTGLGSAPQPVIPPKEFIADHPFVFLLCLKKNILFNGAFRSK